MLTRGTLGRLKEENTPKRRNIKECSFEPVVKRMSASRVRPIRCSVEEHLGNVKEKISEPPRYCLFRRRSRGELVGKRHSVNNAELTVKHMSSLIRKKSRH